MAPWSRVLPPGGAGPGYTLHTALPFAAGLCSARTWVPRSLVRTHPLREEPLSYRHPQHNRVRHFVTGLQDLHTQPGHLQLRASGDLGDPWDRAVESSSPAQVLPLKTQSTPDITRHPPAGVLRWDLWVSSIPSCPPQPAPRAACTHLALGCSPAAGGWGHDLLAMRKGNWEAPSPSPSRSPQARQHPACCAGCSALCRWQASAVTVSSARDIVQENAGVTVAAGGSSLLTARGCSPQGTAPLLSQDISPCPSAVPCPSSQLPAQEEAGVAQAPTGFLPPCS